MAHVHTLLLPILLALTASAQIARAQDGPALDHQGWTLIEIGGHPGARDSQIGLKFEGAKARAAGLFCFELAGPIERSQDILNLAQLKLRYWATCRLERQVLVDALQEAFRRTERYAVVGRELRLMSASSDVLARFVRDTNQLFGSRPWTMTEIDGQPAIRHSPTKLTFRRSGAHADDGCQYWDLYVDVSEQERAVRVGERKLLMKHATSCPPAVVAQAAKLADAMAKADRYEQVAGELRLMAGAEVVARFTAAAPAWPASDLAVGDATFWTVVEIAGQVAPADDRPTLNLVVQQATGRARSCAYSADVRHGHGEIVFWNLAASESCGDAGVGVLLAALAEATRYEVQGSALVLYSTDGVVLTRLEAGTSHELTGTWRLIELAGERPSSVNMVLTLPDGRIRGTVDCNSLSGRIRLGDGMVAFPAGGRVMMTLLRCPGRASNANIGTLSQAKRYVLSGDRLSFLDERGAVVARFDRQASRP